MNSITLKPELIELYTLNEFILNNLPQENLNVNLIVEEIFTNIVKYSKTEFITVNVECDDSTLTMEFIDNGIEFNPLLEENHTTSNDNEEIQIGGKGILITKNVADEIYYRRITGKNHLKIIKNLNTGIY